MKVAIVLTALVCYVCAQTTSGPTPTRSATEVKQELLQRAQQLETKVKAEIQKLVSEKREHLSVLLKEEEQRVEKLVSDLNKATDVVQLAVLESELIDMEYRVDNEVNILQRETATQELLLNNAKILKEWVTEEIKTLKAVEGTEEEKRRAQEVAALLTREEAALVTITERLTAAQDQREIETLEVELRALEVRLYEALRALHFNPGTPTARPGTTARPATTGRPATTVHVTTRGPVTTHAPATTRAATHGPTPLTTRRVVSTAAH